MPKVGTREDWLVARLQLLRAEKEHTRRGDELALMRQQLPWVRVGKDYRSETDEGKASLSDLFRGRSQLLIYHLMFGPDYTAACPSCSAIADGFNGFQIHLANHDVMLWAVSRGPLAKLQAYKKRMNWTFPWASSHGSDFNSDYGVGFNAEEQRQGISYNYRREGTWKSAGAPRPNVWGTGVDLTAYLRERPGISAFVLDDGIVHHTYSAYARGLDALWGMWQWLDRAPKGRSPKGPDETGHWWRRHDEYEKEPASSSYSSEGIPTDQRVMEVAERSHVKPADSRS
jgi:predicted dithiol-disulfide oxidoreductase (DUF899 family)